MVDEVTQELAGLRREVGALTGAIAQVLAALEMQGRLLDALMEAVTTPSGGDSELGDVLAHMVTLLLRQEDQLAAIRAGVEGRPMQARG